MYILVILFWLLTAVFGLAAVVAPETYTVLLAFWALGFFFGPVWLTYAKYKFAYLSVIGRATMMVIVALWWGVMGFIHYFVVVLH
jgi:hypothetical protein